MRVLSVALLLALSACAYDQAFRTEEEVAQRNQAAPSPVLPATLSREVSLRSAPDARSPARQTLASGAAVTASTETVRGFRRVKTADGQTGYVEAGAVVTQVAAGDAAVAK
ncbi:MAG: SH3 domain-containing protein [Anaeromyxobacter sp.]